MKMAGLYFENLNVSTNTWIVLVCHCFHGGFGILLIWNRQYIELSLNQPMESFLLFIYIIHWPLVKEGEVCRC